ncbi:MAG: tetratricopeptide repeat protein [Candidatus Kapaibacterium sp.]
MRTAPDFFNLGLSYEDRKNLDMAMRCYARIIALWPKEIAPYHRLSVLALEQKDPRFALAWLEKGIAVNESIAELWNNRAFAFSELKEYEEADHAFARALSLKPDNWEAYYNFGRMRLMQKRFAESELLLRKAADLDPTSAVTFNNLGLALHGLDRFDEACPAFDRAVELEPRYLEARANKGASLYYAHRFTEAESQFRHTISLASTAGTGEEAGAHYNLSSLLLSQGKLVEGFQEYEWRWKTKDWPAIRNYVRQPLWEGGPLDGLTILVWHEQGAGDTIQFFRLLNDLAKMNCEIEVEIQPELHRLLIASSSLPNVRFHRSGEKLPAFDVHAPLLSLPKLLGIKYETLRPFKPYLRPRGFEIDEWRRKLKTMTPEKNRKKKRIGIAWAGNPKQPADHQRSMTWETIQPIVQAHKDRYQFFSLQPGVESGNPHVIDLGSHLRDYAVTAAIVANLDLIIAVDTSIVHLAGALGKRVWTMLCHTPHWAYVIGEEKTAWYPTMTLFLQKQPGAWSDVIHDVSETLELE